MSTNDSSRTTSRWLHDAVMRLERAGIGTARLDCLILLEGVTGKDRSWLLAHPETALSEKNHALLESMLQRRATHEPLAYIRGRSEFYGHEFIVTPHTLEPRPETETMLDLVRRIVKSREKSVIVDVGTGSGCIAISVKLMLPSATVMATDLDEDCVKTARENAKRLGADITILRGDLLEPLADNRADVLLCNLPYVPNKYQLNEAAKFEPKRAIFGGKDGLDVYRALFAQIRARDQLPAFVLTESLPFQHETLAGVAGEAGYQLENTEDFIQTYRLAAD